MRRLIVLLVLLLALGGAVYAAVPYTRAASLIVRAAKLGGGAETFANEHAYAVPVEPPHEVATREGDVPAQFYVPNGDFSRSVLLIPGIHSMGIKEPRLTQLAKDLAGTGVMVMTLALPDLQQYRITPRSTR